MDWALLPLWLGLACGTGVMLAHPPLLGRARAAAVRALSIRPTSPRKRLSPIEDMALTKARIRQDERQRWASAFEDLAGEPWFAESDRQRAALTARERAARDLENAEASRRGFRMQIEVMQEQMMRSGQWDGLHHATCPYECDCPQAMRDLLVRAGLR